MRPDVVAVLLRERLGVELPAHSAVRIGSGEFTDLPQYRPDLCVLFDAEAGGVTLAVAIEVQRAVDEDKRYRWPLYAAALRARHRCASAVLVVASRRSVAKWAGQPILDLQPGCSFRALVLGPAEIPTIDTVEAARAAPEMAVLSAMAHWREHKDTLTPVIAALAAADELPLETGRVYSQLIVSMLSAEGRATWRKLMATQVPFISKLGRELRAEGKLEGRAEGRLEGLREALRALLGARNISLTSDQDAAIDGCADATRLESWVVAAAAATDATDVLAD